MKINVITLFPGMVASGFSEGLVGQAIRSGRLQLSTINPREFATDVHHSVDDRPFGGGDGMVMMVEPIRLALESLGSERGRVIHLSPQGRIWNDQAARAMAAQREPVTLLSSRYAGVDHRVIAELVDDEISLGDFVLSGGELAAMAIIDSVARFIPGVLGNPDSSRHESFADGLLECPQFTRPREHDLVGKVPEAFLSGNHEEIARFRQSVSLVRTRILRPELFAKSPARAQLGLAINLVLKLADADLKVLGLRRMALEALLKE